MRQLAGSVIKALKPPRRFWCAALTLFLVCLALSYAPAVMAQTEQTEPLPHGANYAVQAGLYVGPIQSNRMAENLSNAGYAAWVEERPQGHGKTLYFVLVGPFTEEEQAREAVISIRRKFDIDPFIVELGHR